LSTKKKKECPLNFINGYSLGFILEIKEKLRNLPMLRKNERNAKRKLAFLLYFRVQVTSAWPKVRKIIVK
jgi:hypothetical protein